MKNFKQKLLAASLLLFAAPLFAAQQARECLPLSTVAAAKFTRAIPSYRHLEDNELWILTQELEYKNTPWQIWFGYVVRDLRSPAEALQKGQAYFNQNVVLAEPRIEMNTQEQFVCKYGLENNTYSVYAISPPLSDPR